MMKWILYAIFGLLAAGGWMWFSSSGKEVVRLEKQAEEYRMDGEEDEAAKLAAEINGKTGERTFQGILLSFLSAGLFGVLFVVEVLPLMAQKMTHSVFDSGEKVERDPLHDARSLMAQGEYEGAIIALRAASAKDPTNRMPWTEIAKIQAEKLHDPAASIETLRQALETQPWPEEDAAFLMFRLADVYRESLSDTESATAILNQVARQFPGTRHAANATHRLHEWSAAPAAGEAEISAPAVPEKSLEEEEAEFLAKLQSRENAGRES